MTRGRPPLAVIALASIATLLFALPLAGLVLRGPWPSVVEALGSPSLRVALRLSLVCSAGATAVAVVLGLPLAWVLARFRFPGRRLVRAVALVPLVLPPVVGGVALLTAFGRRGFVGSLLDEHLGIQLPFSVAGTILAEAFVAMPFFVITAEAAFRNMDMAFEEAGRVLGAGRWTVFRRITVPMTAPALAAGVVLAWARALGEFGATITFAGNAPGRTTTVPLQVYLLLESNRLDGALALSLILLAVSVLVLVGLRDRWLGGL